MTHIPTEDITGDIDPFAIEDEPTSNFDVEDKLTNDDEKLNKILAYVDKAIADHNSFDVLHLPQNATPEEKQAVFDEMFNHKGMVHHLRQIKEIINNEGEQ